jgi:hypothetical protein
MEAVPAEDPLRAARRERVRGAAALRSLSRLGVEAGRIDCEVAAFEAFVEHQAPELRGDPSSPGTAAASPPRRLKRGPLDFLDYQNPGFDSLPAADRARWAELRRQAPDPLLELAWFACDGRRSIDEIAHLAWLETGRHAAEPLREFFGLTARMGISE